MTGVPPQVLTQPPPQIAVPSPQMIQPQFGGPRGPPLQGAPGRYNHVAQMRPQVMGPAPGGPGGRFPPPVRPPMYGGAPASRWGHPGRPPPGAQWGPPGGPQGN